MFVFVTGLAARLACPAVGARLHFGADFHSYGFAGVVDIRNF